jgi:hypothetical protein
MEREIARISTAEIIAAVRATDAPWWIRQVIGAAVRVPSRRLGTLLVRFDGEIGRVGMHRAASRFMSAMGARVRVEGEAPRGAALVVMNHPGAYDALALMTALGRDDVRFLAREREFLRSLPHLAKRMIFVNAMGLRAAIRYLGRGGVVVQLGAGTIEPEGQLAEWPDGTGWLASRAPRVIPAFVSGVHSPRAKRLRIVQWAEARGITTIGPLLQATLPGFRDVAVTLRFGAPVELGSATTHAERTGRVRAAVHALCTHREQDDTTRRG